MQATVTNSAAPIPSSRGTELDLNRSMRPILPIACLILFALDAGAFRSASALEANAADTLSIRTVDDSVAIYSRVEPWPGDFVRATRGNGKVEFIPFHRIRSIRFGDGRDVTDRVLVDGTEVPFAENPMDNPAGAEPSTANHASKPVTVTTTDGVTAEFSRVEPWPGGFIRAVRPNGEEAFLPASKIQRILDPQGDDVTQQVLDNRRTVKESLPRMTGPTVPRSPALRGRPSPEQRGFSLLQVGYLRQLGTIHPEQDRAVLVADAGRLWNVDARHSLGGTVMLAASSEFTRIGVKPRYRRWLSRTVSLDLAPGVFFSVPGDGNPEHAPIGFVGESSLTFGDWFAITGAVHVVGTKEFTYHYQEPTPSPPVPPTVTVESGTRASAFVGAKVGGEAAVVGTLAMLALIGLMILTYDGS